MTGLRPHRGPVSPGLATLTIGVLAAALLLLGRDVGMGHAPGTDGQGASVQSAMPATGVPSPGTARPGVSAGGVVIPWRDASPGPLLAPTPTPSSPPTAPPGTSDCTPTGLSATAFYQGATGSMAGGITVTNRGPGPCALDAAPSVTLVSSVAGPLPVQPARFPPQAGASGAPGGSRTGAHLLLRPGAQANLMLQWFNWCGTRLLGTIAFRVTLASGAVNAPVEWPAPSGGTPIPGAGAPRCDAPQAPSTLSLGEFQLLPTASATPPPNPLTAVLASLTAPTVARSGAALDYRVTLTDPGPDPVPLTPCPNYLEWLAPSAGRPIVKRLFQLNCAPVGALAPGRAVTFEMVLQIPADAPPGGATLWWGLAMPGATAPAQAALTVAAPDPSSS